MLVHRDMHVCSLLDWSCNSSALAWHNTYVFTCWRSKGALHVVKLLLAFSLAGQDRTCTMHHAAQQGSLLQNAMDNSRRSAPSVLQYCHMPFQWPGRCCMGPTLGFQ